MTSNVWISLENRNATSRSHLAKLATVYLEAVAQQGFYYSTYYLLIHLEMWSLDSFDRAEVALQVGSEPSTLSMIYEWWTRPPLPWWCIQKILTFIDFLITNASKKKKIYIGWGECSDKTGSFWSTRNQGLEPRGSMFYVVSRIQDGSSWMDPSKLSHSQTDHVMHQ